MPPRLAAAVIALGVLASTASAFFPSLPPPNRVLPSPPGPGQPQPPGAPPTAPPPPPPGTLPPGTNVIPPLGPPTAPPPPAPPTPPVGIVPIPVIPGGGNGIPELDPGAMTGALGLIFMGTLMLTDKRRLQ